MAFLTYSYSMDLAATYSMRNPKLAMELAYEALCAAIQMGRPDLAYAANSFLCAIGA